MVAMLSWSDFRFSGMLCARSFGDPKRGVLSVHEQCPGGVGARRRHQGDAEDSPASQAPAAVLGSSPSAIGDVPRSTCGFELCVTGSGHPLVSLLFSSTFWVLVGGRSGSWAVKAASLRVQSNQT